MPVAGHPPTALIRLKPEDMERLGSVALPGESRAATFLRLLHEAVLPAEILVRYRKLPTFKDWFTVGPLSPIAADQRVQALQRAGFEVEITSTAALPAGAP